MIRSVWMIALILVLSTAVRAETIFVDDLDEEVRGEGSPANPFRDLQVALRS